MCAKPSQEKNYAQYTLERSAIVESLLSSPRRFQRIDEREDRSDIPKAATKAITVGKHRTYYRGCELIKGPLDMVIYQQLFWHVKPATIIELGAYSGTSALWIADELRLMDIESPVYSVDIDLSLILDRVKQLKPDNVTFLQGDCYKIEQTFPLEFMQKVKHPLIISDDAHVNVVGIMEYFHQYMRPGDYFVVEDTSLDAAGHGKSWMGEEHKGYNQITTDYVPDGRWKLDELKKFLTAHREEYAIDTFFTDYFGYNGSSNWHGIVRRM